MGMPMMGGAGAASGVTNTAVTTTQEHMKSDKGQVISKYNGYKIKPQFLLHFTQILTYFHLI